MCNGWIKLHRKILDWEWYDDTNVVRLFVHFLLLANNTDKKWRGIEIKKGQLVTSVAALSEQLGLSTKQIRIAIDKLKGTNEIAIKTTNKFSLVTICKYESYQLSEECKGQTKGQAKGQTEGNQTANKGQQLKNNKNIRSKEENKKEKKVKEKVVAPIVATPKAESIESRKEKFYQSLVPYVEKYGREMVRDFFDYWTELTPSGRKMRVEQQRVFEIPKRLATWKKNEMKYETNHNRHGESSNATKAERDAEFFAHIQQKLSQPDSDADDLPFALQDI